uniref:Citrate synthase n=2 Tax=Compsopogon caeruleus TaxID=31354 RepID=A0A7S1XFJ4_9RHOD|mmetsp:Transcript_3303/g.6208  ORF Transcript_3303/g.6208 Transcript_3303/m.6208 type:complete len:396 (+) Transcript_3303:291-1478(+)
MERLAERSSFLEVAYLLIYGDLPTEREGGEWRRLVMTHTMLHEDILSQMRTFRYDAHPMGTLIASLAAMSAFHPEANPMLQGNMNLYQEDESRRNQEIVRILGKVATIAACAYRVRIGRPFNVPDASGKLDYTENFLMMLDRLSESDYRPDPRLVRILDRIFIALSDDGMNCATSFLRHVASSRVDPYMCVASASGAQYGSRISGVGDAVLRMLEEIGSVDRVESFVDLAKQSKRRLQGFGHINYKAYDPRARVLRNLALELKSITAGDPRLDIALRLEDVVLHDDFFVTRRVFPNVDLFLSVIISMMGFPSDFFSAIITIGRTAGWLAQWRETILDPSNRIHRPRQLYVGHRNRTYQPILERDKAPNPSNEQHRTLHLQARQSMANYRRVMEEL